METSAKHRLYDAAARCSPDPHWADPARVIGAATQALADGLDSPALRELAGSHPSTRIRDLRTLLATALDELSIPRPDTSVPGQTIATYSRLPTDALRLEIVPERDGGTGHELLVYVNDLEITEAGAGMGMTPFDLLVPTNRLIATTEPRQVVVARCTCGESGCGSTEARITRAGSVVHWEWYVDPPLGHGVTFDAPQYDAEVERIGADQSWQRPVDSVTRLVLEAADRELLATAGLRLSWAAQDHRDPQQFLVALVAEAEKFQVFLRFSMDEPTRLAEHILQTLRQPPRRWRATYHSMVVGRRGRPPMAGWRWRTEDAW
ncbi:hypothetical protein [Kribbella sp. HUAS MG21]|uniref:Uncharacterized protein n=1 Tax=Kribbella sp. HUAS MG21 TaxID=3160966 RepID=A0AAU7TL92_9ACTN